MEDKRTERRRLFQTSDCRSFLLIRILAGWVFLSEGIQKFVFPDQLGIGRFIQIGIPGPHIMAPFVGGVETAGGLLLLVGLLVRPAAFVLAIDISVAILATKVPMLIHAGFWKMAHEARTDFSMLLACMFLLINGAGGISFDKHFSADQKET